MCDGFPGQGLLSAWNKGLLMVLHNRHVEGGMLHGRSVSIAAGSSFLKNSRV
jgi:hypothetical protein